LLPDIIDKPIFLLGFGTGRYLSHNLLFALVSFFALFLLTKKNLKISLPFLIGIFSHFILDIPYVPFFYPFISYDWLVIDEPLLYWFTSMFTNPVVIITEITGVIIFTYILLKNKLFRYSVILDYLKGDSSSVK